MRTHKCKYTIVMAKEKSKVSKKRGDENAVPRQPSLSFQDPLPHGVTQQVLHSPSMNKVFCLFFKPGKLIRDSVSKGFQWGGVQVAGNAGIFFLVCTRNFLLSFSPIVCRNSLSSFGYSYQLRMVGILLKSKFKDIHEWPTLQVGLSRTAVLLC